ncbi:MAG: arsenic efflux protein [Lentisphaerae bacterium]|nr:arsenic efflux protein [Lentisphaerota bacterium]
MLKTIWDIFATSAEGSFVEVTAFVGAVLLIFGVIDYWQQGAFIAAIVRAKHLQPIIGALLGIMPGCGGSVLLMPLYVKGSVTFGTIIATTIATTGDSSFLILTQAPREFVIVTPICFVMGAVSGYITDYFKVGEWVNRKFKQLTPKSLLAEKHKQAEAMLDHAYDEHPAPCRSCSLKHFGHEEGDEIDMILHHDEPLDTSKWGYKITHHSYIVFWVILTAGLVLGVVNLFMVDVNTIPGIPNAGMIIGVLGSIATVTYMAASKRLAKAQSHEDVEHKMFSLRETFIHNAKETAFVGTWVFAAYLIFGVTEHLVGGEATITRLLTSTGLASVLIGVAVGVIPGCGPQVVFVSLYLKGMFPFSALLANVISQDGDALFPLIALDRRAAFWCTVINTIVALIVGLTAYYLGF